MAIRIENENEFDMRLSFRERTARIQYFKNHYKCQEKPIYLPDIQARCQVPKILRIPEKYQKYSYAKISQAFRRLKNTDMLE